MALHINDMVTATKGGVTNTYRLQKLDPSGKRIVLRKHTAATLEDSSQEYMSTISKLMKDGALTSLRLNVLGHRLHDKANR